MTTEPSHPVVPSVQPDRRRIGADIGVQIVGRVVNVALGVVATLVLVRALGDDGFGQWATVFAVVEVVGYGGELGLEQLAVRRAAADRRHEGEWIGSVVALRMVLAAPVLVVVLTVLFALAETAQMRITALVVGTTMFIGAASTARAVFQLRVRNDVNVAILTLNSVLWTLAVVAIATSNGSMVAFAVAFVLVALTTTGLQFVWAIRTQPLRFAGARRRWRQLLRGGIPLGIAGLLTLAYVRIDGVLVFHIAGADQAGLYGAVYRTLDRVQMVPTAVMTTVFPLLAAAWPVDPERVRRLLQAAADHLLMFALPALALAIAAPEPIVRLLFGGEFEDAAPALPVLMGAFVAISLWHLAMNMVIVLGLQRRLMVYAALALIVNVALNLIFIPKHGFMAAAWITLATETLVMALAVRTVLQATGFRPAPRQMSLVTLCACAAGLLAWRLEAAGLPILLVAALMLVGYGTALLAVRALDLRELVGLVRPPGG